MVQSPMTCEAVSSRNPFVERLGWIVVGSSTAIPEGIITPKSTMRQLVAYPSVVTTTFGVRDDEATTATVFSSSGQQLQQVPARQESRQDVIYPDVDTGGQDEPDHTIHRSR